MGCDGLHYVTFVAVSVTGVSDPPIQLFSQLSNQSVVCRRGDRSGVPRDVPTQAEGCAEVTQLIILNNYSTLNLIGLFVQV